MNPAPLDLETVLSPAWLDAALGVPFPGVRVTSTSTVETLTTVATKVRFRLEYDENPGGAPDALCVKGYFENPAMVAAGQVEARFYRLVAPHVDVRMPRCVYAAVDEDSGHGLVLMDDLVATGSRFLTALSPYSVDQAAATLEQLARLHTVDLDTADGSTRGSTDDPWIAPRLEGYLEYVSADRLQSQLDDGRADGLAPEMRRADRVRAALVGVARHSASDARCLVHGDAHAGNVYLDPNGAPGLIDWQVVQRGAWELDVAYHVASVLGVEDRRRNERALVEHYLGVVAARVGDAPTLDAAWDAYCQALAYGYFMWAITQRVDRPIIETFTRRLGTAVEDHGSLERLGV